MTRLFLVPLVLSALWWLFLSYHGLTVKQGAKGFYAIFAFCGAFGLMLTLIMWFMQ